MGIGIGIGIGTGNRGLQKQVGRAIDLDGSTEYLTCNPNNITVDGKTENSLDLNGYERITNQINRDMSVSLGSEIATNGVALTDTNADGLADSFGNYNSYGTCSIVTGNGFTKAQRIVSGVGNGTYLFYGSALPLGKRYKATFKYRSSIIVTSGTGAYSFGNIPINTGVAQTLTIEWTVTGFTKELQFFVGNDGSSWFEIGDLSVKEIPNLVTNGGFDSDTVWNKSTGITISSGVANFNTTGNEPLWQGSLLTNGKKYKLTYTVASRTSGAIYPFLDGNGFLAGRSSIGTYEETFVYSGSDGRLYLRGQVGTGFVGTLDNIHIYEIPHYTSVGNHSFDWTTEDKKSGNCSLKVISTGVGNSSELGADLLAGFDLTTWTPTSNVTVNDSNTFTTTGTGGVYKSMLTVGKTYEITTQVYGSASFQVGTINNTLTDFQNVGGGTQRFTATYERLYIRNLNAGVSDVAVFTLKEVFGNVALPKENFSTLVSGNKYTVEGWVRGVGILGNNLVTNGTFDADANWTKGAGWSISGGVASCNGGAGNLSQTTSFIGGKTYQVTFTVNLTSGSTRAWIVGTGLQTVSASGTYTFIGVANANGDFAFTSTSFVGSIDNVSIKEITQPSLTLSIGNQSKTITNISCVPNTFTKFVFNFQATANEVNKDLKLYCNQADTIYLDDVSISQAYDIVLMARVNHALASLVGNETIISKRATDGYALRASSSANKFSMVLLDNASNVAVTGSETTNVNDNKYHLVVAVVTRDNAIKLYVDNVLVGTSTTISGIGKISNANALLLGNGSESYLWKGVLGETQIVRFNDIAQSNFDPTKITIIPSSYVNGTVVLHMKFRGNTDQAMLRDYSPQRQTVSGVNVTLLDQVKALNPVLGSDLLSGWNFLVNWLTTANTTINNATSFTTTNTGGIYLSNLVVGKTYKLTITCSATGTFTFGSINDTLTTYQQVGATSGTYIFTAEQVRFYLRNTNAGTTTVTALKLEEVTNYLNAYYSR